MDRRRFRHRRPPSPGSTARRPTFQPRSRLADFDLDASPTINPATIATLSTCAYLDAGEPIVLLGDSGTGKSHLLIGFGIAACEQGRRVRYATAAQLVNELAESADERRLSRIVARYGRLDLALRAPQGSLEPVIEMNLRALTEVGLEPARAPKVRQLACA